MIVDDINVGDDAVIGGDIEIKGSVQIGDADGTGSAITIYSDTAGDHIVYSESGKTWTMTDIEFICNNVDISAGEIDGVTLGTNSAVAQFNGVRQLLVYLQRLLGKI